jgi:hypothetical protein
MVDLGFTSSPPELNMADKSPSVCHALTNLVNRLANLSKFSPSANFAKASCAFSSDLLNRVCASSASLVVYNLSPKMFLNLLHFLIHFY